VFGRRLPESLRLFLLTLAMADVLGAIVVIGVLFTTPIHTASLTGAVVTLGVLAALSRWKTAPRMLYAAGFVLVWAFTLQSGINTAVAGLACAFTVPIASRRADQESVLKTFVDGLHPYVAYGVLPLFAFVSAGVSLPAVGWRAAFAPAPLGVALGLVVGKPVGVLGLSAVAVALRLGRRPLGVTWLEMFGVALLGGAGFSMSFFVAALVFPNDLLQGPLRAAVIVGSLLSVLAGGAVLRRAQRRRDETPPELPT
jgi:NhaA family Na+:H+ antiporter